MEGSTRRHHATYTLPSVASGIDPRRRGSYAVVRIEVMTMGPFGRAHEESLRENRPGAYAELRRDGTLLGYLAEIDEWAQNAYTSTVMAMPKANPPTGDSFLERVQHTQTIAQQVRELVMDNVILREDESV